MTTFELEIILCDKVQFKKIYFIGTASWESSILNRH